MIRLENGPARRGCPHSLFIRNIDVSAEIAFSHPQTEGEHGEAERVD